MEGRSLSLVIMGGVFGAGLLIAVIFSVVLVRWGKSDFSRRLKVRPSYLCGPLFLLIPAVGAIFAIPFLSLEKQLLGMVTRGIHFLLVISFSLFFLKFVHMLQAMVRAHYNIQDSEDSSARKAHTEVALVAHVFSFGLLVLTLAFSLMIFPELRPIGAGLLGAAAAVGIILGLAAQKILANIIAGVQIALTQPIQLNDAVVIDNDWGYIEGITLTYVVVRIWDLKQLILPASYFMEKPFQSWTQAANDILVSVYLFAAYTVPIQKVREELERVLEKSPYWDKRVNMLQATNASEARVQIRALMSASDATAAWNLRCEVREKLISFLQASYPESLPPAKIDPQKKD